MLALTVSLTPQTQLTPEIEQPLERISTKATVIEQGDFKPVALASAKVVRSEPEKPTQATRMAVSGNKQDWLRQANIPESDWSAWDYLVNKESSWNPNSVSASSGACGLGQQLPCGKWAGAWNDPVAALKAMRGYVNARYGGIHGAVSHSRSVGWY